jgi:predicted DNA-binding protein (UPF0251 family)
MNNQLNNYFIKTGNEIKPHENIEGIRQLTGDLLQSEALKQESQKLNADLAKITTFAVRILQNKELVLCFYGNEDKVYSLNLGTDYETNTEIRSPQTKYLTEAALFFLGKKDTLPQKPNPENNASDLTTNLSKSTQTNDSAQPGKKKLPNPLLSLTRAIKQLERRLKRLESENQRNPIIEEPNSNTENHSLDSHNYPLVPYNPISPTEQVALNYFRAIEQENQQLQQTLDQNKTEIKSIKEEIVRLSEQLTVSQNQAENLEIYRTFLQKRLDDAFQKISFLSSDNGRLLNLLTAAKKQLQEQELINAQEEIQTQHLLDCQNNRIETLSRSLVAQSKALAQTRKDKLWLNRILGQDKTRIKKLKKEIAKLSNRLKKSGNLVNDFVKISKILRENLVVSKAEKNRLSNETETLKKSLNKKNQENQQLTQNLSQSETRTKELEKRIADLEKRLTKNVQLCQGAYNDAKKSWGHLVERQPSSYTDISDTDSDLLASDSDENSPA